MELPLEGRIVVAGDGSLATAVGDRVRDAGRDAVVLRRPSDRDLARALAPGVDAVVVASRDDVQALRLALLAEHLCPGVRLVVTIFDRTVASQLVRVVPNCRVTSLGEAAAAAFAGPCVDPELLALAGTDPTRGVTAGGGAPRAVDGADTPSPPGGRLRRRLAAQLRPHDRSSRVMLLGLGGLLALVVVEAVLLSLTGEAPSDALYAAVKTVATVGPNALIDTGPAWLKAYATFSMAAAVALTAVFTAGLVNRLLSGRLTGIIGTRTVPRRDHVVVVGLGQVGLRLCMTLQALGVDVVAVERNGDLWSVHVARTLGIPVVIGRGEDRFLLQRLSLRRARALAAVTSEQLTNVAVAVAALAVEPEVRIVLRAGHDDVIRESRSLFHIGIVRDATELAATCLAAAAVGHDVDHAFVHEDRSYVRLADGSIERFPGATDRWPVASRQSGATPQKRIAATASTWAVRTSSSTGTNSSTA
jgi:Trk K+ transport system NAD-binding subunit